MSTEGPTVVTPSVLRDWPLPEAGSGKNARGQLLVVGGTRATPGAVLLAGEGALRAGAGKLLLASVESVMSALGVAVPEASVTALPETASGCISPDAAEIVVSRANEADLLLVGSGFSDPEASVALLAAALPDVQTPTVVDAVASAYLTEHPEGLHHLDGRAVLAVNLTELARTTRTADEDVAGDPLRHTLALARRARVVVVCGGTHKFIATPAGRTWVVEGGGPGLGISGSGDVQAGIISGLFARGAEPAQAAVFGAYLHARAGERLAASVGALGYLAREVPGQVPRILAEIE
jgi:ADP-dependent NAD(P)H-hydrate dehydratase